MMISDYENQFNIKLTPHEELQKYSQQSYEDGSTLYFSYEDGFTLLRDVDSMSCQKRMSIKTEAAGIPMTILFTFVATVYEDHENAEDGFSVSWFIDDADTYRANDFIVKHMGPVRYYDPVNRKWREVDVEDIVFTPKQEIIVQQLRKDIPSHTPE
jgi:hypothetical protein